MRKCIILGGVWLVLALLFGFVTDSPDAYYIGCLVASQVWFAADDIMERLKR